MEVQLALTEEKVFSERQTIGVLDLLGDIGGFLEFMTLFIGPFASFFSAKFFLGDITKRMFLVKLKKN